MIKKTIGLLIAIIIAVVTVSGCIGDDSTSDNNVTTQNLQTFTLSGVTLYIPEGYNVDDEGKGYVKLANKDNQWILVFNWEELDGGPFDIMNVPNAKLGPTKEINNKRISIYFDPEINDTDVLGTTILG